MIKAIQTALRSRLDDFRNGASLKARSARGGMWLTFGSGAENSLRLARNVLLARILAPEAFGLLALVLAVNAYFEAFTEIGIKEAVVQSPRGRERTYLNAAWWLSLGRGLVLFICAFLSAPWIARFYEQPELTGLLHVAFLSILLNAVVSPRTYVALKEMDYKRWMAFEHGGAICAVPVAIVLGFVLQSAWALVIGFALEAFLRCIISYVVCPFRPGLKFERESVRGLFRYARGMFGLPALEYLYVRLDVFVIAKLCSTAELGIYMLLVSLVQIPWIICGTVIMPILMPAFSSLQEKKDELMNVALQASKYIAFAVLPLLSLMACGSTWILTLAYGETYAVGATTFMILCAVIGLRVIGTVLVTICFATGRPELNRRASILRALALVALIVPMVSAWGTLGAALALLGSGAVWVCFNLANMRRVISLSIPQYVSSMSGGFGLSALIMAIWMLIP